MTIRKRRQATPSFRLPPPYQPITGERAPLMVQGEYPYCAMMQVAAEDEYDNYYYSYSDSDSASDVGFHMLFGYEWITGGTSKVFVEGTFNYLQIEDWDNFNCSSIGVACGLSF